MKIFSSLNFIIAALACSGVQAGAVIQDRSSNQGFIMIKLLKHSLKSELTHTYWNLWTEKSYGSGKYYFQVISHKSCHSVAFKNCDVYQNGTDGSI